MEVETAISVDDAIKSRQSMRRFLDRPVTKDQLDHLLDVARHAPSGSNVQPWKVYAVGGEKKDALCAEILANYQKHGEPQDRPRLTGQNGAILERLRSGPATNQELAGISLKYTSRVSDLRKAGYTVACERQTGGLTRYTLEQ